MGRLVLQAGFLTVSTQVAMLLAALPAGLLLPPSLPLQMALSLPLMVGLIALALPMLAERLFGAKGDVPLLRTWFGAVLFAAVVLVGFGFYMGVMSGMVNVTEAQILALLALFFLNLSIAREWLA